MNGRISFTINLDISEFDRVCNGFSKKYDAMKEKINNCPAFCKEGIKVITKPPLKWPKPLERFIEMEDAQVIDFNLKMKGEN